VQERARNTLLRSIFDLAGRYGLSRDAILNEIELEPVLADQVGAFIGAEKLIDAVEFAAAATGQNDFGLRLGGQQNHRALGPIAVLIENCKTVEDAVAEGSRYLHLHNTALTYTLTKERSHYIFRLQIRANSTHPPRHYVEALLMMFVRFCQALIGPNWRPLGAVFEHSRMAKLSAYRSHFGADDIKFLQNMNAVLATRGDFDRPLKGANPRLKELVTDLLDDLDRQHNEDFSGTVRNLLRPLLQSGTATAAHIAGLMSLTPRTFQRRLSAQGTTFQKLLLETRIQLVRDYLPRKSMTVSKMTQLLGFADASGVSRFLRMHGLAKALKVKSGKAASRSTRTQRA